MEYARSEKLHVAREGFGAAIDLWMALDERDGAGRTLRTSPGAMRRGLSRRAVEFPGRPADTTTSRCDRPREAW